MTHYTIPLRKFLLQLLSISIICVPAGLLGSFPEKTLIVMPPMNEIYHPVSTTNTDAQNHFDRGLAYIFAYNHDIAFQEFEIASKLDPALAMAYWGMAYALGQNINQDVTPANEIRAYNYTQHALKLSSNISTNEQKYISALVQRYTNDSFADLVPLRSKYRIAMKKVAEDYPEDLDAATLYAESILDLNPWKWWTPAGQPTEGVVEAIAVLEAILMRDPDHIGANHFYIRAIEDSPYPERALMSAYRLQYLFPESGQLIHISTHIFLPVGDYENALKSGVNAVALDNEYFKKVGLTAGTYPLFYLSHNMSVLTRTYMLVEDYGNAIKTALDTVKFVAPYFENLPNMAPLANVPLEVYMYFHKWDEILAYPLQAKTASAQAYWHFSRAMAHTALGNTDSALTEKSLMIQFQRQIPPVEEIARNPASKVIELAAILLEGSLARAKKNYQGNLDALKKGVELQDQLSYDEPPAWYVPVRQLLGFALLQQQQYNEAEVEFRATLKTIQRNGRTLFGLAQCLKNQERDIDAYWVEREMRAALRFSSTALQLNDL